MLVERPLPASKQLLLQVSGGLGGCGDGRRCGWRLGLGIEGEDGPAWDGGCHVGCESAVAREMEGERERGIRRWRDGV